jgi:diguanylate cyclase (GGDEF)-like protein/PAS domain S-box-containing protein
MRWALSGALSALALAATNWLAGAAAAVGMALGAGAVLALGRARGGVAADIYQRSFEAAPVGLCQLALDGRVLHANRALQRFLDRGLLALQAGRLADFTYAEDRGPLLAHLRELAAGSSGGCRLEQRFIHADGHVMWARCSLRLLRDEQQRPASLVATIEDHDEHKRAERFSHAAEETFRTIAEHVPAMIWVSTPETRMLFINRAHETIWGRSRESVYIDPDSNLRMVHPADLERVLQCRAARDRSGDYEINYRIQRDDGEIRYIRDIGRGVCDERGQLQYVISSAMDITSEMHVRDEMHELNCRLREANLLMQENARLDSLTHCLTRSAIFESAEKALQVAQRYGRASTLVFFDLNDFKEINDNFGHHIGDRGLIAFAEQIKARLRTTDDLGRYGGDEFVALLRETDAEQAGRLLASLTPVVVDAGEGRSVIVRFSAGVACSSEPDIGTVDDWMRCADDHMYRHKARHNGH